MHVTGIFGLLLIFFALFHQVTLAGAGTPYSPNNAFVKIGKKSTYSLRNKDVNVDLWLPTQISYYFFVMALLYTTTFLPAGRYYQRVYGNFGMLFSYFYVMSYLVFFNVKNPQFYTAG